MIKLIGAGIWIVVVTLGAVYFSMQMASAPKLDKEAAARAAALELVSGNLTTIPVIGEGGVSGYLLMKLSYTANKELAAKQVVPVPQMITDELYTLLVGKKMIDVANAGSFDLDAFRATVKEGLNTRFGEEVIVDVLIEQIDYITSAAVHDPAPRRGVTIARGRAPDAKPAEGGTH